MEAHEYPLRSKGGVIIQRSNTPTLKKSRNQPRKAPKEIPIDTDSDASCTSSTTTESTCTESTEAESSTINKPHTLHRIERSEDTVDTAYKAAPYKAFTLYKAEKNFPR